VGDGLDYKKFKGNPVLDASDLPEGLSPHDFRDPKIWRTKDGAYRCVIGARRMDKRGVLLLYRSADGFSWQFESILAENDGRFGLMWECPDFFRLDGTDVLLASAQDMLPKDFEYHNGNGSFYLLGHYEEETGRFEELGDHATDYGIDFYAPQTVLSPDGRRIMIGWMQNWDTCNLRTKSTSWFGQMSLPRELSVRNGVLYQTPIRELDSLRRNRVSYEQGAL
jgi:beta-fructofuranosidase